MPIKKSVFLYHCCVMIFSIELVLFSAFTVNIPTIHATSNWTVNTLNDDLAGGTCSVISCTLRDALNSATNGDTIQFAVTGTILLGNAGTLMITKNVTINGPGATKLVVDGNSHNANSVSGPVLYINKGIIASLIGITIEGGSNVGMGKEGGGIINAGTLKLSNSMILNNGATAGGGIANEDVLVVNNTIFYGNFAPEGFGGGIATDIGTITTISNSTFYDNLAGTEGGAISNGGIMTISNSTISGNTSSSTGGGDSGGIAGGGTLNLLSDIVAQNVADNDDPDIYYNAGNIKSLGYNLIGNGTGSSIIASGTDQIGTKDRPIDPLLKPLADNGGSTQTMAITSSSPAYQKGFCSGNNTISPPDPAVTTDQRGTGYERKSPCDVGAFEVSISGVIPATASK